MLSLLFISLSLIGHAFAYAPQNGDIIFHTSKSSQSKAIQITTNRHIHTWALCILKMENPMCMRLSQRYL